MKTITVGLPKGFRIETVKMIHGYSVEMFCPSGRLEFNFGRDIIERNAIVKSMKRTARVYALMPIKEK